MSKLGIGVLLFAISGCASRTPAPVRLDFVCTSELKGQSIISNCADPQTWREWTAAQQGRTF